jgi:DNA-binding CsgD family transcriptional regulator
VNAGTIVALAQASADKAAFGRALLDGVMRHVGADVGAFRTGNAGAPISRGFPVGAFGARPNPWKRHAAELDPVIAAAARVGLAIDTAVLGERTVRSARYFSEVVRPLGGRETLYAIPTWKGRPAACLLLGRSGTGGRFGHADVDKLHALLPALAIASAALVPVDEVRLRDDLSPRESEIVNLLFRGFRSREIADALGTSVNTVRNQISRLMARLEVGTRAELVAALTRGEV